MRVPKLYTECLKKKRYFGYNRVQKVGRKIIQERNIDLWFYACPYCQNYHLTSHPKKYAIKITK